MPYCCHNRSPRQLLADLGIWHCFGVHALFSPAIATFLFAPLFWIFWCVAAGLVARQDLALSQGYSNATGVLFTMAAFSAYKAFYGLIVNRFHWAKTAHGDQFSQSWAGLPDPYVDSDFCFKRVTKAEDK